MRKLSPAILLFLLAAGPVEAQQAVDPPPPASDSPPPTVSTDTAAPVEPSSPPAQAAPTPQAPAAPVAAAPQAASGPSAPAVPSPSPAATAPSASSAPPTYNVPTYNAPPSYSPPAYNPPAYHAAPTYQPPSYAPPAPAPYVSPQAAPHPGAFAPRTSPLVPETSPYYQPPHPHSYPTVPSYPTPQHALPVPAYSITLPAPAPGYVYMQVPQLQLSQLQTPAQQADREALYAELNRVNLQQAQLQRERISVGGPIVMMILSYGTALIGSSVGLSCLAAAEDIENDRYYSDRDLDFDGDGAVTYEDERRFRRAGRISAGVAGAGLLLGIISTVGLTRRVSERRAQAKERKSLEARSRSLRQQLDYGVGVWPNTMNLHVRGQF